MEQAEAGQHVITLANCTQSSDFNLLEYTLTLTLTVQYSKVDGEALCNGTSCHQKSEV